MSKITINSITKASLLPKVLSSSSNSSFLLSCCKNFSSQTSRLSDSLDYCVDHEFQNPNDFEKYPIGNSLNPNRGFRETFGNVNENNQVSRFGNSGGCYSQNNGNGPFRDSVDNRKGGFAGYDMNSSNGQFRDNHREFSEQNLGSFRYGSNGGSGYYQGRPESQGSWSSGFTQNANRYQSRSSGYYAANAQQSVSSEQYMSNWNGVQNLMEASRVSSNPRVEEDIAESSESSSYEGTLGELDELCKEKKVEEAVKLLHVLEQRHVLVDLPRCLQLMHACGEAKALEQAKAVHDYLVRLQLPLGVSTSNKILEMYGKCGDMNRAFAVFDKMPERDLISWDTMITWLAKNGLGEDAIDLFTQFKQARLVPDAKLFIGLFLACGVVGDVNEGLLHFESMRKDYGIVPSMEHFLSIVNMMGTVGYLDEALEFIKKMPVEPSIDVWETLMNLSRIHGNLELGNRCAELVGLLDPSRLSEQCKAGLIPVTASDLTKEKEKKLASQNLLEVRSKVHEYRAGDTSHPETDRIYAMLRGLRSQMKQDGYIPETRFVLHDIDQESKEDALLAHSERLASAYGLLTSPARFPIRVIKNLRVCGDCHNALKIISKIVGRELIMRDAKRFHHFKDGVCSCRDYW